MPNELELKPSRNSRTYVYRIASVAALGGLLFGYDTAIINGAIVFLKQQFHWNDWETELAASSLLAGCIVGSAIAGSLSDRYGRRRILLLSAAIFAISAIATALPHSLVPFACARLAGGVAIGIASMLAPLYIAEVAPEAIRGQLVSMNQLAITIGILVSYLVGWGLSFVGTSGWRWMFASMAVPSLLFFFALFTVPESPRWLVRIGRDTEAIGVLRRCGESASRVGEIKAAIAQEEGASLFQRSLRKPLTIGIVLAVLQQITGINTILYYGSIIFTEQIKSASASSALMANVIIGAVNTICTVAAILMIDKLGRKPLLMAASAGMAACLFVMGFLFRLAHPPGTLILVLILGYVAWFAIGLGPGVWVVIAELFPTGVRGRAVSISTVSLWVACLVITSTFLTIVKLFSITGAFWLYAFLSVVTFVFVWRVVPETKGQTLEEIERQWVG
ncbi:MAG TPA: sugar porter family MFS transporter [Bryobacteraceae bacterium]|nr:sugar porter family MFS transporter [Bryobacteraceae bacterium]